MNSFESRIYNFIVEKKLIKSGSTVLVGLSGGADSTALLLVLDSLKALLGIKLIAVHVNHGIRAEAGEDALFSQELCDRLDVPFFLIEKDIPALSRELKLTEEEAGRKARYQEFSRIAREEAADYIAIAHHQNDVAETLIMNLLRGSGIHGGGSIRPSRDNVIRPLLCVSRKEIEDYLKDQGQDYCHDATNDENTHTRNIIRNLIIPAMEKEINSESVSHLCRAAEEFSAADEYIRGDAAEFFETISEISGEKIRIDLNGFRPLKNIVKADIILLCFEKLTPSRKDISAAHVRAILDICEESSGSAFLDLPYSLCAERSYDELLLFKKDTKNSRKNNKEYPVPQFMGIGDKKELEIPDLGVAYLEVLQYNVGKLFPTSAYTKWFDYDRIQGAIFRKRRPEDYILIETKDGLCRKKINKLMTDEKIPKSKRDEMYLLAEGDSVIWVPGFRMSGAYKISETTNKILAINIHNGGNING